MPLNIKDLAISSSAFSNEGHIPTRHTGEGDDVSPQLSISGVPEGTQQLAIICHDPDAPLPYGFTHWVCYGIPADTTEIPEGGGGEFSEGGNDMGNTGYNGPMPPEGHGAHHYYFWVYALDAELELSPGKSRAELLDAMSDHIIEQARIVGTYER
jgi:Raf kinase inhibitor-like YbhB/YbcL family protein